VDTKNQSFYLNRYFQALEYEIGKYLQKWNSVGMIILQKVRRKTNMNQGEKILQPDVKLWTQPLTKQVVLLR